MIDEQGVIEEAHKKLIEVNPDLEGRLRFELLRDTYSVNTYGIQSRCLVNFSEIRVELEELKDPRGSTYWLIEPFYVAFPFEGRSCVAEVELRYDLTDDDINVLTDIGKIVSDTNTYKALVC